MFGVICQSSLVFNCCRRRMTCAQACHQRNVAQQNAPYIMLTPNPQPSNDFNNEYRKMRRHLSPVTDDKVNHCR